MDNPAQTDKIKPIMTEKEADEFIKSLPVTGMEWIEDRNRRKEAFTRVLSSGTRSEIAALIELVISHRKLLENEGRKLNAQDERALDEAMRRIDNELAVIKGVEPQVIQEQIISMIDAV
uniref:CarD family transcriptional regulator n=1 Tax=uncultured bacterium Contig1532b TaxID=1393450 RepID=W0FL33_9BACT|nr:CarD family transcriptional regulator [uncultured bacterium Contig1532b]